MVAPGHDLAEAKHRLPLRALLHALGLAAHARKKALCPFHDDSHPSFSVYQNGSGDWRWKCFAGCGEGDEIDFLEKHRGISQRDAVKVYLELAGDGSNGSVSHIARPIGKRDTRHISPFDWEACVAAFTETHQERLAEWRGYSDRFVASLHERGLVGLYNGCVAFPVHDAEAEVLAAHDRSEDGSWRYAPAGTKTRPLVIGDLGAASEVHAFESQWDAFAACDKLGLHEKDGIAVIATRGASNGRSVADLVAGSATVYLWPQNDAPGAKWADDIAEASKSTLMKRVSTPEPHKDLNAWTGDGGATAADLQVAIDAAPALRAVEEPLQLKRFAPLAALVLDGRNHVVKGSVFMIGGGPEDSETGESEAMRPGAFPLHVLNDTMRAIAEATADVHQIPIELPAMATVATMAGAMGKAFELIGAVNGKTSFGNVYVIAAAPKSTGKGAASSIANPLIRASGEMGSTFRENVLPGLKVKQKMLCKESEALYKQISNGDRGAAQMEMLGVRLAEIQRESDALEPLLAGQPTYWVSNATSEAMAIQFARNNCSLFAFSPEGGEPVRVMMGKYRSDSKGDYDLWLSGYSVEVLRTDRVQRGALEIIPCLSALLFCQPCVLRELITDEEAFERGLTARTLPFIVEPELKEDDGTIRSVEDSKAERWNTLIRNVLLTRGNPGDPATEARRIVCSEGAREVFRALHNESIRLRNGPYRDIEGELGRWRENAIRLALGQCLADYLNATELSEAQAVRAVELARWCVLTALNIMQDGRMERRLDRARKVQALLVSYGGTQTLRDLERRHGIAQEEAHRLAVDFPDFLTYQKHETGKPGRPAVNARR